MEIALFGSFLPSEVFKEIFIDSAIITAFVYFVFLVIKKLDK